MHNKIINKSNRNAVASDRENKTNVTSPSLTQGYVAAEKHLAE